MKLGTKLEDIQNSVHKFAPISDLERLEKEMAKNYASKSFVEYIKDEIGDFVKREEIDLLKNDGEV